ncbi:Luciferase-like monooxygenase [Actinoalloteichus cyanogriseus DSM 43889]|uniref:Luciferase-like monooxygenase n=1 Tax=Actinoalloteichus caeruleus DSM 43889 TaxID=1120930 RepID=A0ABT1JJ12_ACTCY|nr:Luciferase-like monooxygenase [Actinoalloteichus caeruleus DSM 43889]
MGFDTVRLSLLDRSRTRAGSPDSRAVWNTVERANWAERFGYHRFWVAEHHAVPGVAGRARPCWSVRWRPGPRVSGSARVG